MQIEEVIGTFSVCVDCDPSPRYIPPDSLVREFASDREAAAKQWSEVLNRLVAGNITSPTWL